MSDVSYEIDQYAYDGSTALYTNLACSVSEIKVTSASYGTLKDVGIVPNNSAQFQTGQDYYLKLTIPQDINYVNSIRIKLIDTKVESGSRVLDNEETYQLVDIITVPLGGASTVLSAPVVFYKDPSTTVHGQPYYDENGRIQWKTNPETADLYNVALPQQAPTTGSPTAGTIYYVSESDSDTIKIGTATGLEDIEHELLTGRQSWEQGAGTTTSTFELIFRPQNNFNTIYLEIVRTAIDASIHNTDGTVGRYLDITTQSGGETIFKQDCDVLEDLVVSDGKISVDELIHVGIWGTAGLRFAINGEQLQIGVRGFYELENFEITELSFHPRKLTNTTWETFTVDYQWIEEDDN